jgi:hypothetical protein
MSIRVYGAFKLINHDMSVQEMTDLLFKVTAIATQYKIGLRLRWNVREEYYKQYSNKREYLPFELLDDPGTNVAEVLFIGDGVTIEVSGKRVDFGENLESRMKRVQQFLSGVFDLGCVENIDLHIDGQIGLEDERTQVINIHDFPHTMASLITKNKNFTPELNFLILK